MTILIVRLLMIVGLCGGASLVTSRTDSDGTESEGWEGNFLTLFWMALCAALGCFNEGLALVAMVITALACGYKFSPGLVKMRGEKFAASQFVFIPLAIAGALIAALTAVYLLFAGVFAVFPLHFDVPFSLVKSVYGFFWQQPIRTWIIYGLSGYLSITGGTAAKVFYPAIKARLKQRRDAKAATAVSTVPPPPPGTND